ncbi:MAG: hypothetical protein JO112_22685 [Planctomycetes bacterium]|nr:hypothetical protein [Planctomycetota bacterium]
MADPANSCEHHFEFPTKEEAERALDFFQNQPGFLGCEVLPLEPGHPTWRIKVRFAAQDAS